MKNELDVAMRSLRRISFLNSTLLSLEYFDIQFTDMQVVWFFLVAVHCTSRPLTFFVLEKEVHEGHEVHYEFLPRRYNDDFLHIGISIVHDNSSLWIKNMREYYRTFVDAKGESRKLIKDEETAIIFRNIQSGSIYVGLVKEDNQDKPLLYIFYMYPYIDVSSNNPRTPFDIEAAERAVRDFGKIAEWNVLSDPKTLFDDLYNFSRARNGKPLTEDGITAVIFSQDKAEPEFAYSAENKLVLSSMDSAFITLADDSITIDISKPVSHPPTRQNQSFYKINLPNGKTSESPVTITLERGEPSVCYIDKLDASGIVARAFIYKGVDIVYFWKSYSQILEMGPLTHLGKKDVPINQN